MSKEFAVIGLGKFGYTVAKTLFDEGHNVLAIDSDEEIIQKIRTDCSQAVTGDAKEKEVLNTLGLEVMDAVIVSLGDNTDAATLVTMYLAEMGVKNIIVKAEGDDHGKILRKVGADLVVVPEQDTAVKVAKNLSHPNLLEYIPITKEDFIIAQLAPPTTFIGKSIAGLKLRTEYNINVIGIERGRDQFISIPPADFVLESGDTLVVVGSQDDVDSLKEID
ncbi:MAG: TrkA family potassium uptake protein [Candidatus Krumholzibacteriales bacterium]